MPSPSIYGANRSFFEGDEGRSTTGVVLYDHVHHTSDT